MYNITMESDQAEINEIKQPHPVFQVTKLSKYLTLVLFVALPFIGGWVGYQLAPMKAKEVYLIKDSETRSKGVIHENKSLEDIKSEFGVQITVERIRLDNGDGEYHLTLTDGSGNQVSLAKLPDMTYSSDSSHRLFYHNNKLHFFSQGIGPSISVPSKDSAAYYTYDLLKNELTVDSTLVPPEQPIVSSWLVSSGTMYYLTTDDSYYECVTKTAHNCDFTLRSFPIEEPSAASVLIDSIPAPTLLGYANDYQELYLERRYFDKDCRTNQIYIYNNGSFKNTAPLYFCNESEDIDDQYEEDLYENYSTELKGLKERLAGKSGNGLVVEAGGYSLVKIDRHSAPQVTFILAD